VSGTEVLKALGYETLSVMGTASCLHSSSWNSCGWHCEMLWVEGNVPKMAFYIRKHKSVLPCA
jgi:hypothetical protein